MATHGTPWQPRNNVFGKSCAIVTQLPQGFTSEWHPKGRGVIGNRRLQTGRPTRQIRPCFLLLIHQLIAG